MPKQVVTGAQMKCSFGTIPAAFVATPKMVRSSMMDAGNILDHKPIMNIPPFGMCITPSNPTVASATTAAGGVLTPMPCVPNTPAPWIVGAPTVLTVHAPSLDNISCLNCVWGGIITFLQPGQFTHDIP